MPQQDTAASAEAAAIAAYNQQRAGKRKMVLGVDVGKYVGFRVPGIDNSLMFGDPTCILKDKSTPKEAYVWRKPDDAYTINMCQQGVLAPVTEEALDPNSPHANVVRHKVLTKVGARNVVRSPGGLGLFEIRNQEAMNKGALANLPGEHWVDQYKSDLAGVPDRFAEDIDSLSSHSSGARVEGKMEVKETSREMIT